MKPSHHESTECRAISDTLQMLGDKWTVLVVAELGERSMRFSELRRSIGNISQKMLTSTLRRLEHDGFATRTVYPTIPPRVDYQLTELGFDLLVPVKGLIDWAIANHERLDAARTRSAFPMAAE